MYADRRASFGGIETHVATLAADLCSEGDMVVIAFSEIDQHELFADACTRGARLVAASAPLLSDLIDEYRIELIHAHSFGAARTAASLRRSRRIPVVATVHGPGQGVPFQSEAGFGVIAVSPEVARPFERAFADRHVVIENGVDLRRFRAVPRVRHPASALRVCYLGRVGPSKQAGVAALHEALGSRVDVHLDFVCDWTPDGTASPSCRVEDRLTEADVVFTTGRGVREAMACGAAACVLGVHWDGVVTPERARALAEYNFSGRMTRERPTPRAIALATRELLFEPKRLAELQAFGPQFASRRWDSRKLAADTRLFYGKIKSEA